MEVVLVPLEKVGVVVEVIEGVSRVVVMKEMVVVILDYISIVHVLVLQDDNVLEIIVVPMKRSCVGFERELGSMVVTLQVTVLGWTDFGVVRFVFLSMLQCRWRCWFLFPRNEQLEGFCVARIQQVLVVDIELVLALDGLVVRAVLVEERVVLVLQLQQQRFLRCWAQV